MANREETSGGEIKIRRARRRVYEQETGEAEPPKIKEEVIKEEIAIPPEPAGSLAPDLKELPAQNIVRRYMVWSAGAGLVPVPFLDMVAITALQLQMLKKLCELYGMDYAEHRAKAAVTSLIGGVHAGLIAGSLMKLVPIIGATSLAALPVVSGAITYAVGRVFIRHFASGGALLDFEPAKVRQFFYEQYREGRSIASGVGDEKKPS